MVKKIILYVLCPLFIVPMVHGMDAKNTIEQSQNQQKTKIKNFEDGKKLIEFREQYRSKHNIFAEEHNKKVNESSRKIGNSVEKK